MNECKHLVFYDGECGLCDSLVQFLIKIDHDKQFAFAPLQGETAKQRLSHLPFTARNIDTLIFIENFKSPHFKICISSQAVFRICWLIGKGWTFLGLLYFLPSFLFDWIYRLVARYRHRFMSKAECPLPLSDQKDRFFP
ncbi:thiol-disulfide oxidoreductase DCC family protein [Candidatus Protochlamydia amoebophila]|uniref:Thiol-disulfide oxidoreductase DCC n=1 Tax=Protochlamydia amoebophila (strain UWE25) TaxID=264201 RepID=Q6MDD4_PARUW|nr:DUF393 domain-containing protein [Candidatus Protochlamydia amoebophila]CAF23415.1 unnamed protein product [Candidatus Protochlamydia amoebophila UWE25]